MRDYWHCPKCDGNFDYGEPCDCEPENLLFITVTNDYGTQKELYREERKDE